MKKVHVGLQKQAYPIYIGEKILSSTEILPGHIHASQAMVVSNQTVATHYLPILETTLDRFNVDTILLPDGEQHKTLDTIKKIFDDLIEKHHRRDTTLIALGGGVIGDITGFAAHCYQRGAPFIQIPTTLLAQVDASVGGKTGVNHPRGKNMIGAFHQPTCVLIDITTLKTLPEREYHSGLAEIIKHGLVLDFEFTSWLAANMDAIASRDANCLVDMIERSCQIKANVVVEDEKEQIGVRQLLNFGHTFAHAIEAVTEYGTYLHGEAVAIGMVMAAKLSCQQGFIKDKALEAIISLITAANLPTTLKKPLDPDQLVASMLHDKKNRQDGQLTLILLKSLGHAVLDTSILPETVRDFLSTQ